MHSAVTSPVGVRGRLERYLQGVWYGGRPAPAGLRLLATLFRGLLKLRSDAYRRGWLPRYGVPIPVLVVGNLTAGGSGKTPLVVLIVERLAADGKRPGVISRGYGGRVGAGPHRVSAADEASLVGDEPLMIARRTGAPVVVGRRRVAAARALAPAVDVIVADDGLQHLALRRDREIVVIDAERGLGNGRLLPAGPLREPAERLDTVDLVITKGAGGFQLAGEYLVNLREPGRRIALEALADRPEVHAVAGIANPLPFFAKLRGRLSTPVRCHSFPDHHRYHSEELSRWRDQTVVMTEKDAVKCGAFAGPDWWYHPVEARLDPVLDRKLTALLRDLSVAS